jgi:hypothetical protein
LLVLSAALALQGRSAFAADFAVPKPEGGRFLLLERTDPSRLLAEPQAQVSTAAAPGGAAENGEAEGSELEGLANELPFSYSENSWNTAREAVETGRYGQEELAPPPQVLLSTEAPASMPPQVEFTESGTSLAVTGRKVISLNYSGKRYLADQTTVTRARSQSLFEITQQMQVRMQGKVGQKISVNVDYDDTKQDKQDISVVYQGDPNEVVQNVSFGDIDLSLPATEFVSYNKQLFGIRADIKTNKFKMTVVGSRTKGITKTKQFTGNTQFQSADLLDINYLRRKYYDVTFGNTARLPIKSGSERIYLDQQSGALVDGVVVTSRTADDMDVPSSRYTGRFTLLSPGIDYVMDYTKGIVTFSRNLNTQDVVIIDYQNANGTYLSQNSTSTSITTDLAATGLEKIIKPHNDSYLVSPGEAGYKREIKTYYSIGQTNIVRDNGNGNFIVKVEDLNRNVVAAPGANTALGNVKYPDTIEVDFEQGILHLLTPFGDPAVAGIPDQQVYSAAPVSKRIIRVEYSYRFKTFTLEPNIVLQSEVVTVDGKKLGRNTDYFIDYDSGFITFYYPDKISQDSKIDISYEVSPFGGSGNQSLVGGRISYDVSNHFSVGSTLLYQGGTKANSVPNVTDLTNSMLVYEGDTQLKGLNLLGLRASLGAEAAQSKVNPNLNNFALVDNMEGVKQEDSPSMDKNYWYIAANPPGSIGGPADPLSIDWYNENIKSREINSASTSDGSQQVLDVKYDFSLSPVVSIVYPLSATGMDFSQKNTLELVVYGSNADGLGPEFDVHLGQIDENADNTSGQTFTCSSGLVLTNAPKSEDLNCDNQVSSAEDIGWLYAPAGKNTKRYGAGNGRLDTEDLNKNGRLDAQDFTGGDFGYVNGTMFTDTTDHVQKNNIDFAGWRMLSIPMAITSTDSYKWNAIKQVRITLRQKAGGAVSGVLKFARISAVGNTWTVQSSTAPGSILATGVNNQDNPGYVPIYDVPGTPLKVYNDLYGSVAQQRQNSNSKNVTEQTLSLKYADVASTSTVYVYRKFSQALDISQHGKIQFLLRGPNTNDNNTPQTTPDDPAAAGSRFYIKAGDENSYFKASVPLDFTGWKLVTIAQTDLTGDKIPDVWTAVTPGVEISSRGAPSLQQVPEFIIGIEATDGGSHAGTVYLDELHLADPITRTGNARKVEAAFEVPGWMSFGGKERYVERSFQTPVTAITNQDNEQQTGYLNISRLGFFPLSATASRQTTETPNTLATGSNNLVNSLQQGRVKKFDGTASGTLSIGALPRLSLNYVKGMTDYSLLSRKDNNDTYAAGMSYSLPGSLPILPRTLNLNYSLGLNRVNYDGSRLLDLSGIYNTTDRTDIYGAKLTFVPWTGSSFNPGYNLQTSREERTALSAPAALESYPKSLQQTADFNSNFLFARWFNPSVNYSMTTMESNNLTVTTVTVAQSTQVYTAGQIKSVNRTAQGGVSLTLNMNDVMPKNKLLRSMVLSSNYQLQDGDVWQNVEKDYYSANKLWIRTPLKPGNPLAQRTSLTLRDTYSSSQRWQPFEGYTFTGAAASLNTLSVTNNFTNSVQRSEVTGTTSRSVNKTFPDMIVSISQLELLTRTKRWAQGATMNLKYSHNTNETAGVSRDDSKGYGMDLRFKLLGWMDTAASYNLRNTEKFDLRVDQVTASTRHDDATLQGTFDSGKTRFTPKVDYTSDITKGTLNTTTAETRTITPGLLIKSDFQLPKGLKLPFMKQTIIFTNRIVWTTTLSYAMKSSPITIADNNRLFTLNSSADYEAAKNLRLTFNLGLQRLWHKYLKQEDYVSYQAGSTLTFQF